MQPVKALPQLYAASSLKWWRSLSRNFWSVLVSWDPTCQLLVLCLGCRVLFRESFPVPVNCTMSSASFSVRVWVSGFMLRSLIHLELSLVKREGEWSIFTLVQPVWRAVCWRRCLFSSMWFWSYNACVALGLGLPGLSIPFSWSMCLFSAKPCCFYYHSPAV